MHLGHGKYPLKRIHLTNDTKEESSKWQLQDEDEDEEEEDEIETDHLEDYYDQEDDPQIYSYPHRLLRYTRSILLVRCASFAIGVIGNRKRHCAMVL